MLRALIDQGSQSVYVTENAAQMLCLPRAKIYATITGFGERTKRANPSVQIDTTYTIKIRYNIHECSYIGKMVNKCKNRLSA